LATPGPSNPAGHAVEPSLFSICCTTCRARLNVRSMTAIGQIHTCPKCGSMVEIAPPPGWVPPEETAGPVKPDRAEPAGNPPSKRELPAGGPKAPPPRATAPDARRPKAAAGSASRAQRATAVPPPLPVAERGSLPPASDDAVGWGAAPSPVAAAELFWRKWLIWAAVSAAGVVFGVGAWAVYSHRLRATVVPPDVPSAQTVLAVEPVPGVDAVAPRPRRLDPRWLPRGTRLLATGSLGELSRQEAFGHLVAAAGPAWQTVAADLIKTLGLRVGAIRRFTWASTDLRAWPEPGVIVVELEEGQDAGVFRRIGDPCDFRIDGQPCRRLAQGDWPHPFAVLDGSTIVTGRDDVLRELADRSEPGFASGPVDRLFKAAALDAESLVLVDLDAARDAGWDLPGSKLDVWPAGREAWHVIWEVPRGLALSLRGGERVVSELAVLCEGESNAQSVGAALATLVPAATAAMADHLGSLDARVESGRLAEDVAAQYRVVLTDGAAALRSARWEVVDDTVWLRFDWGEQLSPLVIAALDSRPAMTSDWLSAALEADRANHAALLSGLDACRQAEGYFPAGAGGGRLLPPETRLSWIAGMLPYYGHADWHAELEFGFPWNSPQNRPVTRRPLDAVRNPGLAAGNSRAGFPVTHYVGVAGLGPDAGMLPVNDPRAGVFGYNRTTRLEDIGDGAGNTIALLGVTGQLGPWAAGGTATVRPLTKRPYVNGPDGFGSGQPGGMLAGMADGSVRFLSKDIDPIVLEQLVTINGAERVDLATLEPRRDATPEPKPPEPKPDEMAAGQPVEVSDDPAEPAIESAEATAEVEPVPIDAKARLSAPVLAMQLPGVPLRQAVGTLSQMSGLAVSFDLEAVEQLGVGLHEPVTVEVAEATVGEVLEAVLAARGLAYVVERSQILVTCPEQLRSRLVRRQFDVSDLTGHDAQAAAGLAGLIQQLVAPDSWAPAGGRGTIEAGAGVLAVVQTALVERQVAEFCEKLRLARGLPLRDPARLGQLTLATRRQTARSTLDEPVSANFQAATPLAAIVADLERSTGADILVHWLDLAEHGVTVRSNASLRAESLPLAEALSDLLAPIDLAYRVVGAKTLEISTRKAIAARLEIEFYPAADLAGAGDPEALAERIKDEVAPATWSDAGGSGVLCFDEPSRCLIMLQSQPVQFEIEALLARWREAQRPG